MDMFESSDDGFTERKSTNIFHSPPSSLSKKSPQVLGPEQAKKRLLAFAQQWNKTKEVSNKDIPTDSPPQISHSRMNDLKHTFIAEGVEGIEKCYPAHLVKFTRTLPSVSYSENIRHAKGQFKSRREVWEASDEETKSSMSIIMNSHLRNDGRQYQIPFLGRSRKWYPDRLNFIGKLSSFPRDSTTESRSPPHSDQKLERYSPHWETDSEEELTHGSQSKPLLDFIPSPPKPVNLKIVSKVKINKIELPFFEDDDYFENLLSSKPAVNEEKVEMIPLLLKNRTKPQTDSFLTETVKIESNPICEEQQPLVSSRVLQQDDQEMDEELIPNPSKRFASSPDADEEEEREAQEEQEREVKESEIQNERYHDRRKERHRSKSNSCDEDKSFDTEDPPLYDDIEMDNVDYGTEACASSELGWIEDFERHDTDVTVPDTKRISLDERLELELGIKADVILPAPSPIPMEQIIHNGLIEDSPNKRKRSFGPKAAALGSLILGCRQALPAAPFVPPHLHSILYKPLVKPLSNSKVNSQLPVDNTIPEEPNEEDTKTGKPVKDWDYELKSLEAVASNLEVADEQVLEQIEEKLLLFEATNLLPSSRDESPQLVTDSSEAQKKAVKRPKRPKPPPIELKPAGKGILVMPRINLLDEAGANSKKNVVFADKIKPGEGTSSSEGEEILSPPLPVVQELTVKQKKKKRKMKKRTEEILDPKYDLLPPPPPPPGSPPPHLPQGRSLSPPIPVETTDEIVSMKNSPLLFPYEETDEH